MKNLNKEALPTINRKNRAIKRWWMVSALLLLAPFAALPSSLGAQVALADSGGEHGHTFDATFTKWVLPDTPPPGVLALMAGIVGGDVGTGTYAGEVIQDSLDPATGIESIVADYHINGSKHSFTARVHVTQTGQTPGSMSVIRGVVTDGWLEGKQVHGGYTVLSCPTRPPLFQCYQGTLHIHAGSER